MIGTGRWTEHRPARGGFALMTVLWVVTAGAVVALAAATAGREAAGASANRVNAARAFWRAHDCAARARAAVDRELSEGDETDALRRWRMLDRLVVIDADDCDVRFEAAGTRLDVNNASEEELRALLREVTDTGAEALADALMDWRDVDGIPRALGAEAEWYDARDRVLPRNGALADPAELRLVRGFEGGAYDSLLTVGPARLSLNTAPLAVLASVRGLSEEVRQRIADERASGRAIGDVLVLAGRVSREAASDLLANYPEIARRTTSDPDAWMLAARGGAGSPEIRATIEMRLVRDGRRAVALRWRSW